MTLPPTIVVDLSSATSSSSSSSSSSPTRKPTRQTFANSHFPFPTVQRSPTSPRITSPPPLALSRSLSRRLNRRPLSSSTASTHSAASSTSPSSPFDNSVYFTHGRSSPHHRSATTFASSLGASASEPEDAREKGFWTKKRGVGRAGLEAYQSTEAPYWMSYSHASMNWDALLQASQAEMAVSSEVSVPARVLDLGCGATAQWCLSMAMQPGWEETEFTALDIVPGQIRESNAPEAIVNRISYVQHNLLDDMPFGDAEFDMVRLAFVGLGIPEFAWEQVVEEMSRVLTPGGVLEIVEGNLSIFRRRPSEDASTPTVAGTPHFSYPEDTSDPQAVIDECLEAVLETRFINSQPLTMLPSCLSLASHKVDYRGVILVDMPALPTSEPAPVRWRHTTDSLSQQQGAESNVASHPESLPRVFLHAYAERMEASTYALTLEVAQRRQEFTSSSSPSGFATPTTADIQAELGGAIKDWCEELKARAGVTELLSSRFGWKCAFDEKLVDMVEAGMPDYKARLEAYDKFSQDTSGKYEMDLAVEFRTSQLQNFVGEAEVELLAARTRLRLPGTGPGLDAESDASIGTLEIGTFRSRASHGEIREDRR